jgi:phosphosulfolactate phosphohydrolase-like enzyme
MNLWKFAAFVTGLVAATVVVRKVIEKLPVVAQDDDHRYGIDDFIDDEEYTS